MPAKNKIVIALLVWLAVVAVVIFYGFGILEKSSVALLEKITEAKKEKAYLEEERDSFQKAKKDLEILQKENSQPKDFFSQDISLVNELRILEKLADDLGIKMSVSGVSGTAKNAPKAKTESDIVSVPYAISAQGSFSRMVDLVEHLENLPFATNITGVSLGVGEGNMVNLSLQAAFYIRRK